MVKLQEPSSPQPCAGDNTLRSVYDGPSPATKAPQPALTLRTKVAKLLDSYLAEVARDSKLPLSKFQFLAEALPEGSRLCDDGLYRAVDTYLKVCNLCKSSLSIELSFKFIQSGDADLVAHM